MVANARALAHQFESQAFSFKGEREGIELLRKMFALKPDGLAEPLIGELSELLRQYVVMTETFARTMQKQSDEVRVFIGKIEELDAKAKLVAKVTP